MNPNQKFGFHWTEDWKILLKELPATPHAHASLVHIAHSCLPLFQKITLPLNFPRLQPLPWIESFM